MSTLFDADGLQITEDWIRAPAGTIRIRDIRRAWVGRHQAGRGSRTLTAALGVVVVLVVLGGAGLSGWLTENWLWILAAPLIFLVLAWIGLLDPLAIYLEKRHHELWISTASAGPVLVSKANAVELRKALRQIQRARQRHSDARLDG